MSWDNNRKYDFYLIFGKNNPGKEPWLETEWYKYFEPLFNKIIETSSSKDDTGLRINEKIKEHETDEYYKEYKLGKLNWDKKSHEKWTLKINDKRLFGRFESWTPRWTMCEKMNKSPDVYLSFWNESIFGSKVPLQFDTLVTIAIAEELGNVNIEIIKELSKNFNSKRTVYVKRGWFKGEKDENGKWNLHDWMDCLSSGNGLYKDAIKLDMHTIEFGKIEFEPYWKIVY
jgi:hypothetical protein